jgi:hypothetical protein
VHAKRPQASAVDFAREKQTLNRAPKRRIARASNLHARIAALLLLLVNRLIQRSSRRPPSSFVLFLVFRSLSMFRGAATTRLALSCSWPSAAMAASSRLAVARPLMSVVRLNGTGASSSSACVVSTPTPMPMAVSLGGVRCMRIPRKQVQTWKPIENVDDIPPPPAVSARLLADFLNSGDGQDEAAAAAAAAAAKAPKKPISDYAVGDELPEPDPWQVARFRGINRRPIRHRIHSAVGNSPEWGPPGTWARLVSGSLCPSAPAWWLHV